jgi:tetratricopeptide (TPR) repeat protein
MKRHDFDRITRSHVVASMAGAETALETRLAELEAFGLGRPPNVLFTEYVAVLAARGVIDTATADQISRAFHAAHYSALDPEDPGFRETISRLQDVSARLTAMPADKRLELSQSVQGDLRTLSGNASRSAIGNRSSVAEQRQGALAGVAEQFSEAASIPWEQYADPLQVSQLEQGPTTTRRRRSVLQIAVMIPVAVGLVFAGYASHNRVDQILENHGISVESHHPGRSSGRRRSDAVFGNPTWAQQLSRRAFDEASRQQDQKAKLAYELYLLYYPDDAFALNNLGWLYLTTAERAVHDPQRGLELGLRAIEKDRSAANLDTAAEGEFQTGNPEEAVKLELEAIKLEGRPMQRFQVAQMPIYRRQLSKFRRAVALKHGPRAMAPSADIRSPEEAAGLQEPPPPSLPGT